MSSSYLPLNNFRCIMGTSQPALSLDKQKTISKLNREQYCQGNKKPSHKFSSCQAYLIHISDSFNIRRTPFYLKIKDIEYQKSYRNSSIDNFHRVGYSGLLLWIEHTQNHIIAYNELNKPTPEGDKDVDKHVLMQLQNFIKNFDSFYP